MRRMRIAAATLGVFALAALTPAWGQSTSAVVGDYTRPNGDAVQVSDCEGLLCGRITSGEKAGFEMLHGMESTGPNEWRGNRMKHPDMPGFMTFNGTVTANGNTLTVRGCAIGEAFCDSEVWTRAQ